MKKILYFIFKYLLGILLILGGIAHFTNTGFYLKAMPSYIPFHEAVVYLSGVIEIGLGVLFIAYKYPRKTAFAIVLLFVAIFPANVNMYINHSDFPEMSETALLIRLPIQLILIVWAYIYTRKQENLN